MAMLAKLMLRENRELHVIQSMEAAFRLYAQLADPMEGVPVLMATACYLAVHAPTLRSQEQTYQMAYRLHRGDRLFEDTEAEANVD